MGKLRAIAVSLVLPIALAVSLCPGLAYSDNDNHDLRAGSSVDTQGVLSAASSLSAQELTALTSSGTRVVQVSLGYKHSAALLSDGSLWLWGDNSKGQLGDGTTKDKHSPTKIMDDVVQISLGYQHSAAVKTDGSLWTWGLNNHGQLGDGTTENRLTPVEVLSGVSKISLGSYHSAAIKNDGSVWAWGQNISSELFCDVFGGRNEPAQSLTRASEIELGGHHSAALIGSSLYMGGDNRYGQLGKGNTSYYYQPTYIMGDVSQVSLGLYNSGVIKSDGSLWVWGSNNDGVLGDGTATERHSPAKTLEGVYAISMGDSHSAAVKADHTLWTWGYNAYGQLGNGTTDSSLDPVNVMEDVLAVCVDGGHTAAITTDGSLWMWGMNDNGQVGDGTTQDRNSPVLVMQATDGEAKEVSGILRQGEGWAIRWKCAYKENDRGIKSDAHLSVYLDGSNESDGSLLLHSNLGNGFTMPWLSSEYGFSKSNFTEVSIIGGNANPFEIISDQFSGYTNVKRVALSRVRTLQSGAFQGCSNLSYVSYDQFLVNVGKASFKNDSKLKQLETTGFITNIAAIGDDAFANTSIDEFAFTNTTSIGARSFANTKLTSALLKRTVTSIGANAFLGCDDLVISCYRSSVAHGYAEENNIAYILLDYSSAKFLGGVYKERGALAKVSFGWDFDLFRSGSSTPIDKLAVASLVLSADIYDFVLLDETLDTLGFSHIAHGNEGNYDDPNRVGYAIASTKRYVGGRETNVIAVVCRGSAVGDDWLSNILQQSYGFRVAANDVKSGLNAYVADSDNGVDPSLPTKVLITGHSRGAAVANILGTMVSDITGLDSVYVYTFACPKTTTDSNRSDYGNIFNIVVDGDPVPHVPPMMFGGNNRFGKTVVLQASPNDSSFIRVFQSITGGVSTAAIDSNSVECVCDYDFLGLPLARHHAPAVYMACLLEPNNSASGDSVLAWAINQKIPYSMRCISIKCPVDIAFFDSQGNSLGTIVDNKASDDLARNGLYPVIDGDKKYVYTGLKCEIKVVLTGTDDGNMEYTLQDISDETGDPVSSITYRNVALSPGKEMTSEIGGDIEVPDVKLYVLGGGNEPVAEVLKDGSEKAISSREHTADEQDGINPGDSDSTGSDSESPGSASVSSRKMHRLYNPNSYEHFYTADDAEFAHLVSLGWQDEQYGWTAPATGDPVYRLYNPNNGGDHHYTMDADERDMLIEAGWQDEKIGWYSDPNKAVTVYREYNVNEPIRNHNYTASLYEHNHLVSLGWRDEQIAWYGVA